MKDAISGLVKSKKFWVFSLTVAVIILNRTVGLELTEDDLTKIAGGSIATVLGFGLADHGKEKAKIEAGEGPIEGDLQ